MHIFLFACLVQGIDQEEMRAEAPLKVTVESQSEAPAAVEVVSSKPEPVVHDDQQVSGVRGMIFLVSV